MHATVRWLAVAFAAAALLVACTRERPTPEATATSAIPAAAAPEATPTAGLEPQVTGATPAPTTQAAPTGTLALAGTATPTGETFQYVVQEGDTLGAIAMRFGTDIDTLRRLNNLDSDALYAGQPLYVPYVEGMTAEGMPTPTPGPFMYTIQPGDSLSAIAARFGVDTITLIETNNLLDPNNLAVGTTILIPGYQPPAQEQAPTGGEATGEGTTPAASGDTVVHVVQQGEGLLDIAASYGVSPDAIAEANNLIDRNILRVGQELIIPGVTPREAAAARGAVHVVAAGESLLSIAVQYGVTVEEIMQANEVTDPNAIYIGQELIIPGQ